MILVIMALHFLILNLEDLFAYQLFFGYLEDMETIYFSEPSWAKRLALSSIY
jgi:hypothetical protein